MSLTGVRCYPQKQAPVAVSAGAGAADGGQHCDGRRPADASHHQLRRAGLSAAPAHHQPEEEHQEGMLLNATATSACRPETPYCVLCGRASTQAFVDLVPLPQPNRRRAGPSRTSRREQRSRSRVWWTPTSCRRWCTCWAPQVRLVRWSTPFGICCVFCSFLQCLMPAISRVVSACLQLPRSVVSPLIMTCVNCRVRHQEGGGVGAEQRDLGRHARPDQIPGPDWLHQAAVRAAGVLRRAHCHRRPRGP